MDIEIGSGQILALLLCMIRQRGNFTHLCRMYCPILVNWTSLISILRVVGWYFFILFKLQKKLLQANSGEPDRAPRSDLVLHCLPMSHRNLGLYAWLKKYFAHMQYKYMYLKIVYIVLAQFDLAICYILGLAYLHSTSSSQKSNLILKLFWNFSDFCSVLII